MAKKRSVYNFLLGFTAGGLVASVIGVSGVAGLKYYEISKTEQLTTLNALYDDLVETCTGEAFETDVADNLEMLQVIKNVGGISEDTYQNLCNYYTSEEYKNEYMLYEDEETYINEILPLKTEINVIERNLPKLEKARQIAGLATLATATVTAYATAMYLNEKDKQKEE